MNAEETNNYIFKQNLRIIESLERSIINNKKIIKLTNEELNKLFVNEYDVEFLENVKTRAEEMLKQDKESIKEFKKINLMLFSKN